MTTRELARKIAWAVQMALSPDGNEPYGDVPALAVMRTLHAHGAWFCRLTVNQLPDGTPGATQESLFEHVDVSGDAQ